MPRSRGGAGGRAPSRPTASGPAPRAPPQQQQQRPHSSAAQAPPHQQQAPPQAQGQSPGLFGQMASTAAGVAVGSSIGHALGGFFGGGSSAPAEAQQAQTQQYDQQYQQAGQQQAYNSYGSGNCEIDAKNFTQCMDQNRGDTGICGWYLEQLKACQASASKY